MYLVFLCEVGIFTERDFINRVISKNLDDDIEVAEVMTPTQNIISCQPTDTIGKKNSLTMINT
jgi:CBS domain-containing protein